MTIAIGLVAVVLAVLLMANRRRPAPGARSRMTPAPMVFVPMPYDRTDSAVLFRDEPGGADPGADTVTDNEEAAAADDDFSAGAGSFGGGGSSNGWDDADSNGPDDGGGDGGGGDDDD